MIAAAVGLLLLAFIGAPIVAIIDKKRRQAWFLCGGVAGVILVVAYVVVFVTADWTV